MKLGFPRSLWVIAACLGFFLAATAQSSQNLAACRNGWASCDRSVLTLLEAHQLALADHQRNVVDCRNGWQSCDASKLTPEEAGALAVFAHQHNYAGCMNA
jgi:hypothetical protein